MGDLHSQIPNGESLGESVSTSMSLEDVLYAPYMGLTMISTNYMAKTGCNVIFEGETQSRTTSIGKPTVPLGECGLTEGARRVPAARALPQQRGTITGFTLAVTVSEG